MTESVATLPDLFFSFFRLGATAFGGPAMVAYHIFVVVMLNSHALGQSHTSFPALTGPYLGQKPPGATPEIFAPGIVNTRADEYALEVSRTGDEILFVRDSFVMIATMQDDGSWSLPAIAPFSGKYIDGEPCFAPDGNSVYFMSRRPLARAREACNLWIAEKKDGRWLEPCPVAHINEKKSLHAPSVAASGNVYDDGIIRFTEVDGKYLAAERVEPVEGGFPFVAPDESYLIVAKRPPGRADCDLFISFRNSDSGWSPEVSLGDQVNSQLNERNAFVTADGKYLFFGRKFDIYWVSFTVLENLKNSSQRAR